MKAKQGATSTRDLVLLGLLVPSLAVTVAAFFVQRDQLRVEAAFASMTEQIALQDHVHQFLAHIVDLETRERGYLLTGRSYYLEPFEAAQTQLVRDLVALRQRTKNDPVQSSRVKKIAALMAENTTLKTQTISLERNGDHAAALKLIRTDKGKQTMDEIRGLLDQVTADAEKQLEVRKTAVAHHSLYISRLLYVLALGSVVSVGFVCLLLYRLSKLRSLVTVCAWSKTIEDEGEWISFEEYLRRRFQVDITHGISPAEAKKLLKALPANEPTRSEAAGSG